MKTLKFNPEKDMKELEKYGFEFKKIYGWGYEYKNSDTEIKNSDILFEPYEDINVVTFVDGVLYIHANTHMVMIPPIIYDLIKADLLIVKDDEDECKRYV